MKNQIAAAIALLTACANDIRPGGQAEIQFKQALVELQGLVDAPDEAPKTIVQTEIATEQMALLVAEQLRVAMEAIGNEDLTLFVAKLGEVFLPMADALAALDAKLDGMEDVLGDIQSRLPAEEPATAA